MARWSDLVNYVRSNYKIADEGNGMLKLVFGLGDNRSQIVFLWHQMLQDRTEEWVQIESPFAEIGQVSLHKALEAAGNKVCGGAIASGNHLFFRHAVPLADMSLNEFERPLNL